jgi:3-oxoadipate enol-lactonase
MTDVRKTRRGTAWQIEGPDTAPALLFLNSLGTTMDIWRAQVPVLAGEFRVIRLDTRGHGRSSSPAGEYTIDDLGNDALRVLDEAGVPQAHVCGVSLGGMTAMWLAAHAPERVLTLIPVSTGLKIGASETWEERRRDVLSHGLEPLADGSMGRWLTDGFRRDHPQVVAWCRAMLTSCNPEGYARCCAVLRDADLHDAAPRIAAPALVVAGESDPVTPPSNAHEIAAAIPDARVLTMKASHVCALERPDDFTSAVRGFIASQAVGRG